MPFGDTFLKDPGLVEGPAGARRGSLRRVLDVPGGPYALCGLSPEQAEVVHRRYGDGWLVRDAGEAYEIHFGASESEAFHPFPRDGRAFHFELDPRPQEVRIAGPEFAGRLGIESRAAEIWTPEGSTARFEGVVENVVRIATAYRLLFAGGVLLHSSSVVDDAGAWLFCGASGAGKTTMAELGLRSGRQVLSDDLNGLCRHGDRFVVAALPFTGQMRPLSRGGERHPLRGLYWLQKGKGAHAVPHTPGRGLALLTACSPFVNTDPYRSPLLDANLHAIREQVGSATLTFSKEAPFEEVLGVIEAAGPPPTGQTPSGDDR